MPIPSELLSRTKPLADPTRVITALMLVSAVLLALVYSLVSLPKYGAFGLLTALSIASGALSCAILVGAWKHPNAIYLRAFRTDRSTARLRAELAAILGPEFRLSGIRPPREKSSIFLRFWLPGMVALRYAGSKFMELEAGDDWIARLWKTYQTTRIVFIDARDLTPYVHQEIEMTLETMGPERCVFLVCPGGTEQEVRSGIPVLNGSPRNSLGLKLLTASNEQLNSQQLEHDLKEILKTLPAGSPGETDRGRQFVLEHVSEDHLKTSRRPSMAMILSAVVGLALSATLGILPRGFQIAVLLPLAIVTLFVVTGAIFRTIGRIRRFVRVGHRGAAVRASLLLAIAGLPFICSILLVAAAIPKLRELKHEANEIAAINYLRTLQMAELMYDATYPEKGYACNLQALGGDPQNGPPTPDAAQLVSPDLALGKKAGYSFGIAVCTRSSVQGHEKVTGFQIYAVPFDRKETGRRGFCTDESGEIRVDQKGGTNCTEPLRERTSTAGSK